MMLTVKISGIDPRTERETTLQNIREFLDNCDPDNRVDITIEKII